MLIVVPSNPSRMARKVDDGSLQPYDASSVKVFGTETHVQVYRLLLDIVGPLGYLSPGSPGAILSGRLERAGRLFVVAEGAKGLDDGHRASLATP